MIELSSLWLPPKPAIIRPAAEIIRPAAQLKKGNFLPGWFPAAVTGRTPFTSIQVAAVTTSVNTSQITIPNTVIPGDCIIFYNRPAAITTPTGNPPTGFTAISNIGAGGYRMITSYRIADEFDAGRTITGVSGASFTQNRLIVLRANLPMRGVFIGGLQHGITPSGPLPFTVTSSQAKVPFAVVATYSANTTSNVGRGFNPAKDNEEGSNNPALCWIAWKMFNPPATPVDVAVSINAGTTSQGIQAFYVMPTH